MGLAKFILHLFFGEKKETIEEEVTKGRGEEKELEREEQKEVAEEAQEIAIEEKEKKEETQLLDLEGSLTAIIQQQKGITTDNLQQLNSVLQEMKKQFTMLTQDETLLEKGITANEQTVKMSLQNIEQEGKDFGTMETDITKIVDTTLKSKLLGGAEKIKGAITALKEQYTNIANGIIQKQKQLISKTREIFQKLQGLLQELETAVRTGKSAEAIQKDQNFIIFTKQLQAYTAELENTSKQVMSFNTQAETHQKTIKQNLDTIQTDRAQAQAAVQEAPKS